MPYTTYTLETLRARLQDRYEAVPFWTDDDAQDALNETLRVWNMLTGYWKRRIVVQTIPNDIFVALPGSVVYNARVAFNERPLGGPSSLFDMDYGRRHWQGERTSDGGTVPREPQLWLPINARLIAIWPADAVGLNALTIDGVTETPVLTVPDSPVDIGDEELSTLLGYALHAITLKEGGPRFLNTMPLYKAFLQAASLKNRQFRASSFYRKYMGLDTHPIGMPIRAAEEGLSGRQ